MDSKVNKFLGFMLIKTVKQCKGVKMKKFLRQSVHKKVRLAPKWRRPKGRQSKKRLVHAGHSKGVSSGYGLSKSGKGKLNGKEVVMVSSLKW